MTGLVTIGFSSNTSQTHLHKLICLQGSWWEHPNPKKTPPNQTHRNQFNSSLKETISPISQKDGSDKRELSKVDLEGQSCPVTVFRG